MIDIQCVFQGMAGKGSIYISNFQAAEDLKLLQSLNIKAILSVARSGLLHHSKEDIPHYLYIPAQDSQEYELHRHFNETYSFIEQARKDTNVLVHCMSGISRSVTIVMAYLLKKYKTSLSQVISMMQRRRKKINPNKGFIQQLKKYAIEQGIKCDFEDTDLSKTRQRSLSNHKKLRSSSIGPTYTPNCRPNNPLSGLLSNNFCSNQYFSKTVATKSDSKQLRENEEKPCFQRREEKLEKKVEEKQSARESAFSELSSHLPKVTQERRKSIEEKINLVRQKFMRNPQGSSKLKINSLKYQTQSKPSSQLKVLNSEELDVSTDKKNKLQDHFHPTNREKNIVKLIEQQRAASSRQERDFSPILKEALLENDFYLKSETLYEKFKMPKYKKGLGKTNK